MICLRLSRSRKNNAPQLPSLRRARIAAASRFANALRLPSPVSGSRSACLRMSVSARFSAVNVGADTDEMARGRAAFAHLNPALVAGIAQKGVTAFCAGCACMRRSRLSVGPDCCRPAETGRGRPPYAAFPQSSCRGECHRPSWDRFARKPSFHRISRSSASKAAMPSGMASITSRNSVSARVRASISAARSASAILRSVTSMRIAR